MVYSIKHFSHINTLFKFCVWLWSLLYQEVMKYMKLSIIIWWSWAFFPVVKWRYEERRYKEWTSVSNKKITSVILAFFVTDSQSHEKTNSSSWLSITETSRNQETTTNLSSSTITCLFSKTGHRVVCLSSHLRPKDTQVIISGRLWS